MSPDEKRQGNHGEAGLLPVFLDAEPFVAARFQFSSGALQRFQQLCRWNRFMLLMTKIGRRELERKLNEEVDAAVAAFQTFSAKATVLRLVRPELFKPLHKNLVQQLLRQQLNTFLSTANVVVVPTPSGTLESVIDLYFEAKPPFGAGKKKAEFPDAISMHALETWCQQQNEKCYVVSRDMDLQAVCDGSDVLLYVESLHELFSLIREEDRRALELVERGLDGIKAEVTRQFEGAGVFLEDEEGDVENVKVTDIELVNATLHEVTGKDILFEVTVVVSYEAGVSFRDYSHGTYDGEEGRYITWDTVSTTVARDFEVTAYGHFVAHDESLSDLEERHLNIDLGGDVPVAAQENLY